MLGKQNDRSKSDDPIITVDQINKSRDVKTNYNIYFILNFIKRH